MAAVRASLSRRFGGHAAAPWRHFAHAFSERRPSPGGEGETMTEVLRIDAYRGNPWMSLATSSATEGTAEHSTQTVSGSESVSNG